MEMSLEMVLEPDTSAVADGRRADRDLALLEALRRHESTAAERLLTTYGERAYRLAVGITGNEQDAEEVVQDALWSVVRKIDTFRGESAFGSWLYRVVANAAYQKLRGRQGQRRDVSLDEVLPLFDERGRHVGARGRPFDPDRVAAGAHRGNRRVARWLPDHAGAARRRGPVEWRDRGGPGSQRPRRQDARAPRPAVSAKAARRRHDDVGRPESDPAGS